MDVFALINGVISVNDCIDISVNDCIDISVNDCIGR